MTYDILLLAAAATSTAMILFAVVIWGDFQTEHCKPDPQRRRLQH
jgi:hypothetical protein